MTTTDLTGPANEASQPPLRQRHPAELTTFIAGVLVIAAALGLDLSEEQLLAGLAVVTGLPAVVTWFVGLFRDALRDLGD